MFPDSKIETNFSLSHTSSSYTIGEGMSPYFTRVLLDDLIQSKLPFCIHFDETRTTQVKKQMNLDLHYWSTKHQKVWSMFYTSLFFGHAEGDKVAEKMYDSMLVAGLPMNKLATLIRDGPNVNKTIFRKVNKRISEDHPNFPGLVDLGSCTIHMVHNAFGKALEQYGKDIDQLCTDLHSLFKYSAARHEDFKELQIEMDLELHNFCQHTEVQWLSIGPAIKRIL